MSSCRSNCNDEGSAKWVGESVLTPLLLVVLVLIGRSLSTG